jgi:antitoxin component of MazEF toxin-antitoxin module
VYTLATLFLEETGMAKLTRWGNSIGGLRLPKAIIEAAGLRVGDELTCRLLNNGTVLLTPLRAMREAQQEPDVAASILPAMKW